MKAPLIASISLALVACAGAELPPPKPVEQSAFGPMVRQLNDVQKKADELPQQRKADLDRAVDQAGQ